MFKVMEPQNPFMVHPMVMETVTVTETETVDPVRPMEFQMEMATVTETGLICFYQQQHFKFQQQKYIQLIYVIYLCNVLKPHQKLSIIDFIQFRQMSAKICTFLLKKNSNKIMLNS